MRVLQYTVAEKKEEPIKEAFKAGSSAKVAEKLYRVLSRKVGKMFIFSDYPTEFSNKEGKFLGYYATLGNMLVRINFLLGKSDNVHSLDVFGKDPRTPDDTLHLMGSNIIQVVDQVADYFTGDYFRYAESSTDSRLKLTEAIKYEQLMKMWIENEGNDNLPEDISKQQANIESEYQRFSEFCQDNNRKEPKHAGAFLRLLKNYVVREMGNAYNIPSIEVLSGQTEMPINTDPQATQAYNELLENEHLLKFKVLEYYVSRIAAGDPDFVGVYVYGSGGVGKSHIAKRDLKPLSETFYFTGKVKGYTGLVKFLYNHKEGEIIVMDDSMTVEDMKNSAVTNVLKLALDPEPPRRIMLQTAQESSVRVENGTAMISLTEAEMKEVHESLNENTDLIDMTSDEGMTSPNDFTFDSKMVFLTNYPKVPQALEDRCWTLEMIFSNEQVIEIIETLVEKIVPNRVPEASELFDMLGIAEVTNDDKAQVLEYMKNGGNSAIQRKTFSIRLYKRIVSLYAATKHTPMWKHFLEMEMKAL